MIYQNCIEHGQKISKYGDVKKAKVVAICMDKSGRVLVHAHNRKILGVDGRFSIHAEEDLVNKIIKRNIHIRYKDITILILRFASHGLAMARPCENCQSILEKIEADIYYSDNSGRIVRYK